MPFHYTNAKTLLREVRSFPYKGDQSREKKTQQREVLEQLALFQPQHSAVSFSDQLTTLAETTKQLKL